METEECHLLARCFDGDQDACQELVVRNAPRVLAYVRIQMGPSARGLAESGDVVQEVLSELLTRGARYEPSSDGHLHALLLRMAHSRILEIVRYGRAACRDLGTLRTLQSGEISRVGPSDSSSLHPDRLLEKHEQIGLVQVAVQLLDCDDREIVIHRTFEGRPFEEIGARLGVSASTAEKRYRAAVARLGKQLRSLGPSNSGPPVP